MGKKRALILKTCTKCAHAFLAKDAKRMWCDSCLDSHFCICGCGQRPKSFRLKYASSRCAGNDKSNPRISEGHKKQGLKLRGEQNPSKRPEVRVLLSRAVTENHPSKTHPDKWKRLALRMRGGIKKSSRLEQRVREKLPPEFKQSFLVEHWRFDFGCPEKNLLVEVQGCWFHGCTQCFPGPLSPTQKASISNDQRKLEKAVQLGWVVIYLWEHNLKQEDPWSRVPADFDLMQATEFLNTVQNVGTFTAIPM